MRRRLLLLSTYELGAQPLGCADPAAWALDAGHEVRTCDLAVEDWPAADLSWADACAISVPMHTALRLALAALGRIRRCRPDLPVALHGLYAPVAATTGALVDGDLAVAGDASGALLAWLDAESNDPSTAAGAVNEQQVQRESPPAVHVELGSPARRASLLPRRSTLPGLERYAQLCWEGTERLVGTVETTQGCNHRCRHCPVPTVYAGRSRRLELVGVLADVDQLVEMGARHIHLADPDFLNRPAHALSFARSLKERHPTLSFDATVKVSHVLRHRQVIEELGALGCAFVISALESTSELVLERLAKGHTSADAAIALGVLRAAGIEPRPSFLPFTPWTTRADVVELLDFVARHDLIANVDPVQYGIRLLLPPGSLLLEQPDEELRGCLGPYDPDELGYRWTASDPLLDELAVAIAARVELLDGAQSTVEQTYDAVRALVHEMFELSDAGRPETVAHGLLPGPDRPHLSESWFCCAEPTSSQLAQLQSTPANSR